MEDRFDYILKDRLLRAVMVMLIFTKSRLLSLNSCQLGIARLDSRCLKILDDQRFMMFRDL